MLFGLVKASAQQKKALEFYLTNGGDAADAYVRTRKRPLPAHYGPKRIKSMALNWFAQPTMKALMAEADSKALVAIHRKDEVGLTTAITEYGITKDRIMAELAKIAFAQATDVMSWGPDGVIVKESSELGDAGAAVGEVSSSGGGEDPINVKVKLLDKRQALIDLGKELGMFQQKTTVDHRVAVAAKFIIEGRD